MAVALLATVGAGAPEVSAAPAQTAPTNYVALGDSFTSGALVPNQTTEVLGCLRSDHNWPHLVFPSSGAATLRDMTCSGASTRHMTQEHGVTIGTNPPQFSALDASTSLVTLQISGNDIGFGSIIEECAVQLHPFGDPCQDRFVVGGVDEISARIATAATRVSTVLDGIEARAPQARVILVGYPALLPDRGIGCWPVVPVAWADVPYLRAKTKELNAMLAAQAAAHGVQYVDLYTPSIGKDACASPLVRWVEPLIPLNPGAPVHPNDRGHRGMADVVRAVL